MDVLVFEIGGVRYALPTSDVSELARAVTIVPLPKAPPIVEGIINVHGRVVPVLDIRTRFRLPLRPVSHTDHLIVAHVASRLVALRADRALDLAHIDPNDIEEAHTCAAGAEYISGVAKLPDGLVLIHDLRTFLEDAEAAALDKALGERESSAGGAA
jgi:purine-binding chemotaxis protein CheW